RWYNRRRNPAAAEYRAPPTDSERQESSRAGAAPTPARPASSRRRAGNPPRTRKKSLPRAQDSGEESLVVLVVRLRIRLDVSRVYRGRCGRRQILLLPVLHPLVTHGPNLEKSLGLFVQALAIIAVEGGFLENAKHGFRPEVVLVVKTMHRVEDFFGGQARILNVGQLMSAFIDHLVVGHHESVFHGVIVELGAGISVRHGHLYGFHVKFFGKRDCVVNRLAGFTRQSQDEITVDDQPELVTVLGELPRPLDRRALLDVLENLLIARFIADDEQTASRLLHRLKRFKVCGDARCTRPGQVERFQFSAQINGARLLDIESVVVEEKFFYLGPIFLGLRHFSSHIIGGTLAPGMSAEGLWPQAKRTLGWTSAGGVQRDIRMQQKRHVVARHIEVSLVNVGYVRQGVEVLNLRRIRIVHGLPVFQIRDSRNLIQRLSVGEVNHRIVEFLAGDEINRGACAQRFFRQHADVRTNKGDLDAWITLLYGLRQADVPW